MTQKEIIEFEENNTDVIWLYLEGSFYKAYERSAFAFCTGGIRWRSDSPEPAQVPPMPLPYCVPLM